MQFLFLSVLAVLATVAEAGYERQNSVLGLGNLHHHKKTLKSGMVTSCEGVEEHWYSGAIQDNFAPLADSTNWVGKGQRYFENSQFWGGPGYPIFVFIGGEGEESCKRLTDHMYLYDQAKEHKALLLDLEHRFYGESYPTPTMTTEELSLLSSDQALADLARFITWRKSELGAEESKVLTVGGSYPGNLAAWFRLKYPAVTDGSIASSAPLMAKEDFFEYMDVVKASVDFFDPIGTCNSQIASAVNQVAAMAEDRTQWSQLDTDYQNCAPMETDMDMSTFMSVLMGNIQGVVQYNNENAGLNVTNICEIMASESNGYAGFMKVNTAIMGQYGMTCNDVAWNSTVAVLADPAKDPSNNMRPWIYQSCREFGYWQTANSPNTPYFGFQKWLDLDYDAAICKEAFGWTVKPDILGTNTDYGSIDIAGTNIILSTGTIDPWHALGATNETVPLPQSTETKVYILGTAHCADLYAPNAASDPESLTNARQIISNIVDVWMA